jgi:hypothetical protein
MKYERKEILETKKGTKKQRKQYKRKKIRNTDKRKEIIIQYGGSSPGRVW